MTRRAFSRHFDMLLCEACGTQRFVPRGDGVPEFAYDSEVGKYAATEYLLGNELRWAHRRLLRRDWKGRKVLEIGCFNGFFLAKLRELGADVYGFDINHAAIDTGRRIFGLDRRLGSSFGDMISRGPFDVIVCIDVIEHLKDPAEFLREISNHLADQGRVVVAGPTVERRFFDKSDYPPHHQWRFSRPGLKRCLEQIGFSPVLTESQYDGLLFLRNFIGKLINGFWKREYYGEVRIEVPPIRSRFGRRLYDIASHAGEILFHALGISYCSTIIEAQVVGMSSTDG